MEPNRKRLDHNSLTEYASTISVDPKMARRLFAEEPLSKLQRVTGEALTFEYFVTFATFLLAPITHIAACLLAAYYFDGTLASLFIGLYWLLWHVDFRRDSFHGWETTFLWYSLVAVVSLGIALPAPHLLWLALSIASLLLSRAASKLATIFFRQLVSRNPAAFESYRQGIRLDADSSRSNLRR